MLAYWGRGLSWVLIVQLIFPASVGMTQQPTVPAGVTSTTATPNPFGNFDVNKLMQNYAGACSAMSVQQNLANGVLSGVSSATNAPGGDQSSGIQAGLQGGCPTPAPVKGESFACSMFSKGAGKKDKDSSASAVNFAKLEGILNDEANGGLDPAKLKVMLERNAQAVQAYACQEGRLSALEKELNCIRDASQSFAQQVMPLMQLYQQNLSKMQADVTQLKTEVADREQQEAEVKNRLGGDRDSGRKGLIEVRDGVKALLSRMNTDIDGEKGVKTALKDLETNKEMLVKLERGLADKVQTETLSEAKKCFAELADPNFRTERNGPPSTLKAYMLAQYERSFQKTSGKGAAGQGGSINSLMGNRSSGLNDLSKATSNKAQSRKQSLESLIDSLFNVRPVDPLQGSKQSSSMIRLDSNGYPKVSEEFSKRAREYNDTGLDVSGFITQGMNYCLKLGRREVARKRTRLAKVAPGSNPQQPQLSEPDSVEGMQQSVESTKLMIKRGRDLIQTRASDLMNEYSNGGNGTPGFNDAMKALTGLNLPINISACQAAAPEVQVGCLQDFRKNMNEILGGTGKNSSINMVIPGQNPKNTVQFTCAGLDGCIAALQNVKTNLPKEREKIQQFGKQYVQKSNQNVQQFTAQAKEKMSKVNEQLMKQLGNLNTAFASLGIAAKINPKTMKPEELQMDRQSCFQSGSGQGGGGGGGGDTCLYQQPKDMQAFLGALDMSGDVFGSATDGLAKKREAIEKDKQDAIESDVKIKNAYSQCADEAKEKAESKIKDEEKKDKEENKKLSDSINDLNIKLSKACIDREKDCGQNTNLMNLTKNLSEISSLRGIPGINGANLTGSIAEMCPSRPSDIAPRVSDDDLRRLESKKKDACDRVTELDKKIRDHRDNSGSAAFDSDAEAGKQLKRLNSQRDYAQEDCTKKTKDFDEANPKRTGENTSDECQTIANTLQGKFDEVMSAAEKYNGRDSGSAR